MEIALILSSLAGIATAAVVRKVPSGRTRLLSLSASPHIKSQISSLKIEKEMLAKMISRLHQADLEYTDVQRDMLLSKYQHQLGAVLAKLEKLEQAGRHPDLGPVGDGLITLMDQKLTKLHDRLDDLSSKMEASTESTSKTSETKQADKVTAVSPSKTKDRPVVAPTKPREPFEESIHQTGTKSPEFVKPRRSFEITTLTSLSKSKPKFPTFESQMPENIEATVPEKTAVPKPRTKNVQKPAVKTEKRSGTAKVAARMNRPKVLTETGTMQMDDEFDDDSDELARIQHDVKKALSKLDQAEVE